MAVAAWIDKVALTRGSYLFPSRQHESLHLSVRQCAWIAKRWLGIVGGNPLRYGTHSLRRIKAMLIYRRTKNLRAVQLLLGYRKLDSTGKWPCFRGRLDRWIMDLIPDCSAADPFRTVAGNR